MSINETCGSCGSSVELDRNDEVELWERWRKTHKCMKAVSESFFSQANSVIESAPVGFAPAEDAGRRDVGFDE